MNNQDIARILYEISEYLAMQNVPFKPRAYERASEVISSMNEELSDLFKRGGIKQLERLPGVGKSIAQKIVELLKTGKLQYYERLKSRTPVNLSELSAVEGLGPKRIKVLYQKLGIKTVRDLEKAAQAKKIQSIEGFGGKTEERILKSIAFVKSNGERRSLGVMMPSIAALEKRIRNRPEVDQVTICGSIRRRRETIGDIDILATSSKPLAVIDFFVKMPEVAHVYAKGPTKALVRFKSNMDVDLRVVPKDVYGAAVQYFTGSKDHNVVVRELAQKKGYKLNEYGLFKGEKLIAAETEAEIYKALGLEWMPPELRENTGEIELAIQHKIPQLIEYQSLKGDLQVQSNWADGTASIEQMAAAAMKRGLEYIAITDHTQSLKVARGLTPKQLREQMKEIDKLNAGYREQGVKFRILKGTECDILKDGSLDLPDDILSQLEVVGISIHSHFKLSRGEQTERIIKAMRNPHADILFHPTGRIISRREAYEVDIDAVIAAAKKTRTVLEINAFPDRSDLNSENIKKAVTAGVRLAIDSDAHSTLHFPYLEYGISQARRGWAKPQDVINTLPVDQMLALLKK